jgi:hypothetical protein
VTNEFIPIKVIWPPINAVRGPAKRKLEINKLG